MQTSESIENIASAFVAFQAEIKNPKHTKTAKVQTSKSEYSYNYTPLDVILNEVRQLMANHGLSIYQDAYGKDGAVYVSSVLMHKSGEWIQVGPLELDIPAQVRVDERTGERIESKPTPQAIGSALTYARRYSLCALLNISAEEDDDAQTVEPKVVPPVTTSERTAGGASIKSLNFAKNLLVKRGIARAGTKNETEEKKLARRDDNNLSVCEYLEGHGFPVQGEDALRKLSPEDMSSLIDTLKAEIEEADHEAEEESVVD